MAYFILRHSLFPLLKIRVNKVEGMENLPPSGPYIIAGNHESSFDPIFIGSALIKKIKKKIHVFTLISVFTFLGPILGKLWLGMIPAGRYNHQDEATKILNAHSFHKAIHYLKKGKIVGIFPEGKRNTSKVLLRGKTGVAKLALESRAPVVPIGYIGPPTWSVWQGFKNLLNWRKKIIIKFGQPLIFDEYYDKEMTKEVLEAVTSKIMMEIGKLCGKTYPY